MTKPADNSFLDKQAIAASEERFRALVTATSDVVYSLSADWRIMRELDGRGFLKDAHEPTANWQTDNIYPADLGIVKAAIAEAIRLKKIFQLEHRVLRADGTPGWTFSRAVPIMDEAGEIIEWFGMASDITDRKKAEEALQQERERSEQQKRLYETITSGTPDLIYVFDLNYRFTYANNALLNMWGKTEETAIGRNLLENGYEPWHAEMHEREIDHIIATRQPVRGEVSFPHATLGRRVYDYILTPVINDRGEVEAVAGTTRDVTDRKQWEQSLAESAEQLQSINKEMVASNEELASTNEELAATNEELTVTVEELALLNNKLNEAQLKVEEAQLALRLAVSAANFGTWYIHSTTREFVTDARLKELFGYYPDEALSIEQALAQISGEYRGLVAKKLENAIYNGGDYDVTYPAIGLHDNKLRWLRAIGNLKADPSGAFSAFTGVVMDVSESKQDEIRKNDFIGMVSHELKTPLTSLSAIIQVANSKLKTSNDLFLAEAMSKANIQVKRMSSMINGFLNVSRLESGRIQIEKSNFNIEELVREITEEMKLSVTTHHISLEECSPINVYADREKINSVISNLIGNAVKYSPKGTTIRVLCISNAQENIISVQDEGPGIRPADAAKIFDRYYRVESSSTQHISGFGIGLYLSAEIVERHGGRIWLESEPGKGATFYFSLPVSK
jgi:two-component system sensor histidine kinase VicK